MSTSTASTASLRAIWPAAPTDRQVPVSAEPAPRVAAHRRVSAARWLRIPGLVVVAWFLATKAGIIPSPTSLVDGLGLPLPDLDGGTIVALVAVLFLLPFVLAASIIGFVLWRILRRRAQPADWSAWAAERGLAPAAPGTLPQQVPLFGACNRTPALRWSGPVGAHAADIGVCWYLVPGAGDDPDEFNAFAYIAIQLPPAVAERLAGTLAQQHRADRRALPRGWKQATFESGELDARYHVATAPGQDELELFRLFDPAFIERVTHGPALNWHQVGPHLVAWRAVGGTYTRSLRGTSVRPALHPALIDSLAQSAAGLADHYTRLR